MLNITGHQGNANTRRVLCWLRNWGPGALRVGMYTGAATVENSTEGPQKTKKGVAI